MFSSQRARLNQALATLAANLPETRWIVLLTEKGMEKACFPDGLSSTDRITAMAAASVSLGERISKELQGGDLRYHLVGGDLNTLMAIHLHKDLVLALGLRPGVATEAIFLALREHIAPLLQELKIDLAPDLLRT